MSFAEGRQSWGVTGPLHGVTRLLPGVTGPLQEVTGISLGYKTLTWGPGVTWPLLEVTGLFSWHPYSSPHVRSEWSSAPWFPSA